MKVPGFEQPPEYEVGGILRWVEMPRLRAYFMG